VAPVPLVPPRLQSPGPGRRQPTFSIVSIVGEMRTARLRVHGELADHLRPTAGSVGEDVEITFELPLGVRDLVQSAGIPHVEIACLEIDGEPADWTDRVDDGVRVEVWPRYPVEVVDVVPRFELDVHLGKLARFLRLLGFDAEHGSEVEDAALAQRSIVQDRVLLTRDRGLLMRSRLRRGRWIRATDPVEQAVEVVTAFGLRDSAEPFRRCLECNGRLVPVEGADADVPVGVRRDNDTFSRCDGCGRVYWRGSHWVRLRRTAEAILERSS